MPQQKRKRRAKEKPNQKGRPKQEHKQNLKLLVPTAKPNIKHSSTP